MTAEKAPAGLAAGGRQLWREVCAGHALRADERRTLLDACCEADLIDALQSEMQVAPRTVKGSMGQTVIHPLVSELRQHRATLNSLLRSLALAADTSSADDAARASREAALTMNRARWDRKRAS